MPDEDFGPWCEDIGLEHRWSEWEIGPMFPREERFCSRCGGMETQEIRSGPAQVCEDCGGPGVSWEDGVIVCDDCAILRAKKHQMDRERRNQGESNG